MVSHLCQLAEILRVDLLTIRVVLIDKSDYSKATVFDDVAMAVHVVY